MPDFESARRDFVLLGLELADNVFGALVGYAGMLERESRETNLIGPSELPRLWRRHILESACYTLMLDPRKEVIDVGSGPGLPGVVIAVLGFRVVMLEPRGRRYSFIRRVLRELGVDNAEAARKRVENCSPFEEGTQFVARSVLKPAKLNAILEGVSDGTFTCTRRYGSREDVPEGCETIVLPVPPLDRPGYLVQYRHPD
jgi:16S rRNA (guanine(527)-N(7))-methyltransferase RsmG